MFSPEVQKDSPQKFWCADPRRGKAQRGINDDLGKISIIDLNLLNPLVFIK